MSLKLVKNRQMQCQQHALLKQHHDLVQGKEWKGRRERRDGR
jgi:hypothetical protein